MEEFEVGDIVIHKLYSSIGEGKIIKIHEDEFLTVDFEHYTGYSYVGTKPLHGLYSHHSNFKLVRKEDERKEKENIRWYRNGKLVKSFENFINESNINDFYVGQRVMAEDPNGRMRKGVILVKHSNNAQYIGVKFDDYGYNCHNLDGACEDGYGYWVHFEYVESLEEEDKTLKIKWFRDGKLTKENFREEIDPYNEEEWEDDGFKIMKFDLGDGQQNGLRFYLVFNKYFLVRDFDNLWYYDERYWIKEFSALSEEDKKNLINGKWFISNGHSWGSKGFQKITLEELKKKIDIKL